MNEGLEKAGKMLSQAARSIAEALNQWIKAAVKEIQTAFEQITDNENLNKLIRMAILTHIPPYKWVHLSKYAKKSRTRKKYQNRIRRFYGSDDW